MSNQELQEEEKEVLSSIYDCDECFKQSSDTSFSYRALELLPAASSLNPELIAVKSAMRGLREWDYVSDLLLNQSDVQIGEAGDEKSFLVEITWGESYPDELPSINLDAFFNNHLNSASKKLIIETLNEEASGLVGTAMTYSLFELAKEKAAEMIVDVPENEEDCTASHEQRQDQVKTKEKKLIQTKRQKRRLADRCNAQGELPRGWNWVDIVKHLSKTGSSQ